MLLKSVLKPSCSYTAVSWHCWITSHDALSIYLLLYSFFAVHAFICHYIMSLSLCLLSPIAFFSLPVPFCRCLRLCGCLLLICSYLSLQPARCLLLLYIAFHFTMLSFSIFAFPSAQPVKENSVNGLDVTIPDNPWVVYGLHQSILCANWMLL